jgi:hypothetical protein
MATHKAKLSNLAVTLLTNALHSTNPPWKRDVKDTAVASQLVVITFNDHQQPPASKDDFKKWSEEKKEYSFTERERDTVKFCLNKLGKDLPSGRAFIELDEAFGFSE